MDANDPAFNCVFISHAHEDKIFAQKFRHALQNKLNGLGYSITVWIDDDLKQGENWRHEIEGRLNSTALVVVILSPYSLRSSWVLYEWHYSLFVQQSAPFLAYLRKCTGKKLKRLMDHQLPKPLTENFAQVGSIWEDKSDEITDLLQEIAGRLKGFPALRTQYDILTDPYKGNENQEPAAEELGRVSEGLKLASANYLISAMNEWIRRGRFNGQVLIKIANALARMGKKKAIPSLVAFSRSQPDYEDSRIAAFNAIESLSPDVPL